VKRSYSVAHFAKGDFTIHTPNRKAQPDFTCRACRQAPPSLLSTVLDIAGAVPGVLGQPHGEDWEANCRVFADVACRRAGQGAELLTLLRVGHAPCQESSLLSVFVCSTRPSVCRDSS
jgi:hypothetical protein